MGKFKFTPEDFSLAAIKYRSELLMMPIIGINDTLKFMTGRPGIRYSERVGTMSGNAQFAPYDPKNVTDLDLNVNFRELRTYFGSVIADFEPNSAASTILGKGATKGDGQIQTPTARNVLALVSKGLSGSLNDAIWNGVRNATGKTTKDLFDGFDTITAQEKKAGNISTDKGNYLFLRNIVPDESASYTEALAFVQTIVKGIMALADPKLRSKKCFIYCPQWFFDLYQESYMYSHMGTPYNTKYKNNELEGTNGLWQFCPMSNKAGSAFIHISPQENMLVGYDQMGDVESVNVKEYRPFVLSYVATMFFGVQFQSIAKENLLVVEFPENISDVITKLMLQSLNMPADGSTSKN